MKKTKDKTLKCNYYKNWNIIFKKWNFRRKKKTFFTSHRNFLAFLKQCFLQIFQWLMVYFLVSEVLQQTEPKSILRIFFFSFTVLTFHCHSKILSSGYFSSIQSITRFPEIFFLQFLHNWHTVIFFFPQFCSHPVLHLSQKQNRQPELVSNFSNFRLWIFFGLTL